MTFDVFRLCFRAGLLVITPETEDRIEAYKLYLGKITTTRQQLERMQPNSTLNRLARAANRQERMNAISVPKFYELQKRQGERAYGYMRIAKNCAFWLSIAWGLQCFSDVLNLVSPGSNEILSNVMIWANDKLETVIRAITPRSS